MSHSVFKYLFDIQASIESIEEYPGAEPSFEVYVRNRVIHGYDSVDNETVWGVVTHHLPYSRSRQINY